ncbi:dockerin type I domain-containing protein [Ruminococcus sp.]|uniref:dockerin type I domain-containing protein n=1 Tax=Ruminococcus sp. TaxID=41978 RepID=UPI0025F6826B|nr:dockerin type I domain-containing protein [Ruminococcus sp.]MCI6617149.1 dockerin type I domain-containing protein [Ruminococcus sp.]
MSNKQKVKPKRLLSLLLTLTMVLGMLSIMGTTTALAYTGNGTKSSPYVVTTYDELKSLMQNAPTDNIRYIRLGTDIKFSESKNDCSLSLTSSLQRVVLDLYGHTISRSGTTNDEAVINVTVGDLTIQDSIDGGKVVVSMNGGDIKTALLVSGEGKLTVYGGTFDSNGRALVARGGNTVINGGTFLASSYYYTAVFESGTVTVNDGYFCEMDNAIAINITDADVTLNGCTLNGSLSVQTDIWDYIPDNRTALVDNDIAVTPQTYHGKDLKAENGKIEIIFTDGSEKYPYLVSNYIDLKAMMQYAPMDGSVCNIKLASDITFQSNEKNFSLMLISSAQNVVVDLNGHTLTRSGKTEDECIFGVAVGALTIKDSVGGGKVVGIKGDGNLLCNLYVGGNGKLTVDSGTFEAEEGFPLLTFGGTTVINGGTFVTESGKCAAANFINSTATLNGGTFRNNLSINTDEDRSGIWIHKNSNVTVYSCDTLGSIWTDSFDVIAPGISVLGTDKYGTTYSVSDAAALKEAYMLSIGRLISQVAITGIDTPKVGNKPDTSATVNVTGADNAGVTWYDWTDNKTLTSSDVFKVGHDYMVMVTLNAKSGYIFSTTNSTLDISINGNKGFLWLANPQRVQCCYNFETLTEPQPVITLQPSGGHSPYMGDSIVLKIDAENANEYIWHVIDENGNELAWNYLSNNGYANLSTSEGGKKLFLYGVSDWMTGKRVYCEVKGNGGTVKSDIVTLSVDKVVKYCMDMYFDNFDEIWNHKTVGDYKNVKTDTNAPYTITEVRWQLFNKVLSDDFEFSSGDTIALLIGLAPKEGYELYVTSGSLNGINSVDAFHMTDGRQYLQFEINITAPDEYKTQNIELSVAEPVAGVKPSTTAACTSGYAIPGTPSWTPADTTFKSGTQYTVKIPVKAEYEWGDISTVTAKVNGKDAKFIVEYKGGKQYAYYVEYTFDATKDYLLGDVNGDGKVTVVDATTIQQYLAGLTTLSSAQLAAGDVNGDGNITVADATQIQKYIAGLIDKF